jgi:YHS domain-containing protein
MLRYLLWVFLAFTFVRLVSRLFRPGRTAPPPPPPPAGEPGVLVQDPVCGTFVDRSRALAATDRTGQTLYFCSEACRRKVVSP